MQPLRVRNLQRILREWKSQMQLKYWKRICHRWNISYIRSAHTKLVLRETNKLYGCSRRAGARKNDLLTTGERSRISVGQNFIGPIMVRLILRGCERNSTQINLPM